MPPALLDAPAGPPPAPPRTTPPRTAGAGRPPSAGVVKNDVKNDVVNTPAGDVTLDGVIVDRAAVEAAGDVVARYLGELGLPLNGREARSAVRACLDAAVGEAGPDASAEALTRAALTHAILGVERWLSDLPARGPVPPAHAKSAAGVLSGTTPAVPAECHKPMVPQRFGR